MMMLDIGKTFVMEHLKMTSLNLNTFYSNRMTSNKIGETIAKTLAELFL